MAVLLRGIAESNLSSARVLVVDPHGEYASALDPATYTKLSARVGSADGLRVPFWALSFDELAPIAFGPMSDATSEHLREQVRALKLESAGRLAPPVAEQTMSADSPIPFSLRRLWHELRVLEDVTYTKAEQTLENRSVATQIGNPESLLPTIFPPASLGSAAPFQNTQKKNISRQLDFLRARLLDPRFTFMFANTDEYHPDQLGAVETDLDELLSSWIGSSRPITILDVSGLPPEVLDLVVGAMLTLIYEALFWGMNLRVGGKNQPLLVVLDEAHRFVPSGAKSSSSRVCQRIAREGRKYGVGLMVVTQRPSDIDPTILSQCGSMISLRVTNGADRAAVSSTVPDDLGNLTALLPSLRTGECLILGDALQIPSRVRVAKAPSRPIGDDPKLPDAWQTERPEPKGYQTALAAWRTQELAPSEN